MKTVKEIKEVYEWSRAIKGFSQNDMNELIFGVLIGITEHLDAREKPCAGVQIGKFMDEGLRAEVRREAMIEVLRWECGKCGGCTSCEKNKDCRVPQAIARLENGGDL